jgi:competence protein ComEC
MAVTVLIQPSYAWGDLGWQLSFAAFAGVMILAPLIQSYFFGDKPERPLRRILIETIAAQICTLPILLLAFEQISIIAPIANILILPLVPLAMLLTFIAGIAGLLLPGIAMFLGLPAQLILTYMTMTAEYVGSIPWAVQEIQIIPPVAVVMYILIGVACIWMSRVTTLDLSKTSLVE